MNNTCTIYIVRHGETERNVREVLNGQEDSALTAKGIEQAENVRQELKHVHFDAIYSSDLERAKKTAGIIKGGHPHDVKIEKMLTEKYCGKFEGQHRSLYKQALEKNLETMNDFSDEARWTAKPSPEVESDHEVAERFTKALKIIAKEHADKTVLVVSHGGCIRSFLVHVGQYKLQELPGGSFGNCGYVKVQCDGEKFKVLEVKGVKNPAK